MVYILFVRHFTYPKNALKSIETRDYHHTGHALSYTWANAIKTNYVVPKTLAPRCFPIFLNRVGEGQICNRFAAT